MLYMICVHMCAYSPRSLPLHPPHIFITALADRARNLDGGVFAESLNSLNGNNNFATSFFNSSGEANPVTGDRRR